MVKSTFNRARRVISGIVPKPLRPVISPIVDTVFDVIETGLDIIDIILIPVTLAAIAGVPLWIIAAFIILAGVAVISGDEDLIRLTKQIGLILSIVSIGIILYTWLVHSAFVRYLFTLYENSSLLRTLLGTISSLVLTILGSIATELILDELLKTDVGQAASAGIGILALLASLAYLISAINRKDIGGALSESDYLVRQA